MEISSLAARYEGILATIEAATQKAGRSPESVTLVGVTKNVEVDRMQAAYRLGVHDFGENRVQEWVSKTAALANISPRWHLIGHLQTNKVKRVVGDFLLIHSVDSWRLAEALDEAAREKGLTQAILVQVNASGEPSKYGLPPDELPDVLVRITQELRNLRVEGLMTVAPYADDPESARPFFKRLRELRDNATYLPAGIRLEHLSMGMSRDYAVAVEEGATLVRVGSALFGPR